MVYKPKIITRQEAGIPSSPRAENLQILDWPKQKSLMVLHYPGDPGDMPEALGDKGASRLNPKSLKLIRSWFNYHVLTRGWSDIGYNLIILRSGAIIVARGWDFVPAAHASKNEIAATRLAGTGPYKGLGTRSTLTEMRKANYHYGLAVCVMVGNHQKINNKQKKTLRWLRSMLLEMHPGVPNVVYGHKQLAPTTCPGLSVQSFIDSGEIMKPLRSKPLVEKTNIVPKNAPIGYICNNPGCLRPFPDNRKKWAVVKLAGIYKHKTKGSYAQFHSADEGMLACMLNLRYYIDVWKKNTIRLIVPTWAPSGDGNNEKLYIDFLSEVTGLDSYEQLEADAETLATLGNGIARREMGTRWAHPHYSRENFLRVIEKYQAEQTSVKKIKSKDTNLIAQKSDEESNSSSEDSREEMRKELVNLKRAITKVQKLL